MLTRGDLTFEVVRVRAPKGETLETYEVVMFRDLFTHNLWSIFYGRSWIGFMCSFTT